MAYKQSKHIFQGMNRDFSEDKQKNTFYIDAYNIRVTAREDGTLLSVTNEKGNTKVDTNIYSEKYVGHAVLNNYLILFTKDGKSDTDHIWRINMSDSSNIESKKLYSGNLGFSTKAPIETIVDYETEALQKVYWTDGINPPRVINIKDEYIENHDDQFDFTPTLTFKENITITKNIDEGLFNVGVIQYVFTYINKLGIETNPFYVSPLYYISHDNRGGEPNTTVANNFSINIKNVDTTFKYINVYSVQRTSVDTTVISKLVSSIEIKGSDIITYVDKGTTGEDVEAASLFYLGSKKIIASTFAAKDGTLFLGNIQLNNNVYNEQLDEACRNLTVEWVDNVKSLILPEAEGTYYTYKSQLNNDSQKIKGFKQRETYRLGLQFQEDDGTWSEPYFVKDSENNEIIEYYIDSNNNERVKLANPQVEISGTLKSLLQSQKYKKIRPVIVLPDIVDRSVLCQGIICPTVYNVEDRLNNRPYSTSSWFARPDVMDDISTKRYYILTLDLNSALTVENVDNTLSYMKNLHEGDEITVSNNSFLYSCIIRYRSTIFDNINGYFQVQGIFIRQQPIIIIHNKNNLRLDTNLSYSIDGLPNVYWKIVGTQYRDESLDQIKYLLNGTYTEFRHDQPVPNAYQLNGEIQCLNSIYGNNTDRCYIEKNKPVDKEQWLTHNSNYFFIDRSIITFHSPDVELSQQLFTVDTSPYQLRIVGIVPVNSYYSDIDITLNGDSHELEYASNDGHHGSGIKATGLFNAKRGKKYLTTNTHIGFRNGSYPHWIDAPVFRESSNYGYRAYKAAFPIYPWHRTGALNNEGPSTVERYIARLVRKKMSHIYYSDKTVYFDEFVNYSGFRNVINTSLNTTQAYLYDGGTNTPLVRLATDYGNINYYGEYDKLVTSVDAYNLAIYGIGSIYKTYGNQNVFDDEYMISSWPCSNPSSSDAVNYLNLLYSTMQYSDTVGWLKHTGFLDAPIGDFTTLQLVGNEPVRISYKSTPHYVLAFNKSDESLYNDNDTSEVLYGPIILPTIILNHYQRPNQNYFPFWINDVSNYDQYKCFQDTIAINNTNNINKKEYLYIAELYNPNVNNRFGGDTPQAIKQNTWIPAGEPVDINTNDDIIVNWTEGDTYYQRYDCLKTYEYSNTSTNNVTEIISFMCETRVNIDGRYDRNRGIDNILHVTNENFNLINNAYSQNNNFYSYQQLGETFTNTVFPNQITWTKTKKTGAIKDNWTNITLANILDLDGDKGKLNSLYKYKNDILAFQDKGISQIIYNPNVQVSTESGMPIELANSQKVQGKRYLFDNIGCQNKWSICTGDTDKLYFIDNYSKSIYQINSQGLVPLTELKGLSSWLKEYTLADSWVPFNANTETNNFRTFYDKKHKDVYFVSKEDCLVYSDLLEQFTSFMSYEATDAMFNIKDKFYAWHNGFIFEQFSGNYNSFWNTGTKPYWITFIENAYPESNKLFTNLDFRSDTYDSNNELESFDTFDTIRVWNEYQDTEEVPLEKTLNKPSNIQKKFRVWRVQIPRDKTNIIDRISNTWAKITLKKTEPKNKKLVLHDAVVGYFV